MTWFSQLVEKIESSLCDTNRLIIAIDGLSGSGKSYLSEKLSQKIPNSFCIH